jgi:hypothetical protein
MNIHIPKRPYLRIEFSSFQQSSPGIFRGSTHTPLDTRLVNVRTDGPACRSQFDIGSSWQLSSPNRSQVIMVIALVDLSFLLSNYTAITYGCPIQHFTFSFSLIYSRTISPYSTITLITALIFSIPRLTAARDILVLSKLRLWFRWLHLDMYTGCDESMVSIIPYLSFISI